MHRVTAQKLRDWGSAYLFILPNVLIFLAFVLGPIIFSIYVSLTKWSLLNPPEFIGLGQYAAVFGDGYFWQYFGNTLFLMLSLPFQWAGALAVAFLLNRQIKGRVLFRTLAFMPNVCSGIAIALLWRTLYNYDSGLVNIIIRSVGLPAPNWLGSVQWAKPAMMVVGIWAAIGGVNMILFLAALQNVPDHYYEAAILDGANGWQVFWRITWPLISPTTLFIVITTVIGGFQAGFELAYALTRGGPGGATTTLIFYIYRTGFDFLKMGYASALAWILFFCVFFLTVLNWKFGERAVFYG
jgi:multiple sugar transport system permease protein